jgi:hypothetical protein
MYMRHRTAIDIDVPPSDGSDEDGAFKGMQSPPHKVQWDTDSSPKDFASRGSSSRITPKSVRQQRDGLLIDLPDRGRTATASSYGSSPDQKVAMSMKSQQSWSEQKETYWVDEDMSSPAKRGMSAGLGGMSPAHIMQVLGSPKNLLSPKWTERDLYKASQASDPSPSPPASEDDSSPLVKRLRAERTPTSKGPSSQASSSRRTGRSWSAVRHKFWGDDPTSPKTTINPAIVNTDRSNAGLEQAWATGGFTTGRDARRKTTRPLSNAVTPKGWSMPNGLTPKSFHEFSLFGRSEPDIIDVTGDVANADEAVRLVAQVPDLSVRDNNDILEESFEDNADFWLHCRNDGV